jgi:hypothetical protein
MNPERLTADELAEAVRREFAAHTGSGQRGIAALAKLVAALDEATARAEKEASFSMKQAVKMGKVELRLSKVEAQARTLADALERIADEKNSDPAMNFRHAILIAQLALAKYAEATQGKEGQQ